MDRIAIIGINREFAKEHRIRNEIRVFASKYLVDGYGADTVDGLANFYPINRPPPPLRRAVMLLGSIVPSLRMLFVRIYFRNHVKHIRASHYRFLIPHHIDDALVAIATGLPFVFNSEEYLPRQFDGSWLFRFMEIRYRHQALQVILSKAAITCVEGSVVARQYASTYGLSEDCFIVMPNMPGYRDRFRSFPKSRSTINLIHHGGLVPERGLELLIDVIKSLGKGYRLTLMGPGPTNYVDSLRKRAEEAGNVEILAPVPYEQIVEALHGHDLGLIFFGSRHFHHKYMTVPNKFWECLQARVPVLVSPESAMADYVRQSGCGIVANAASLAGYVAAIRALSRKDIEAMKGLCEAKAWIHSRDSWLRTYAENIDRAVDAEYGKRAELVKE